MSATANPFGKIAMLALGAAALASPFHAPVAQEEEHADHAAAEAPLTDEQVASSRALFGQYGCAACHVFGDANGTGHIGPALDGNASLSVDYVNQIISNGQGAMPSFGGMVSEEEIETLSRYIVEKKR